MDNIEEQINQYKEAQFKQFINMKTALETIDHKKIVQNMFQKYTTQNCLEIEYEEEHEQFPQYMQELMDSCPQVRNVFLQYSSEFEEDQEEDIQYLGKGLQELKQVTKLVLKIEEKQLGTNGLKYINKGLKQLKNLQNFNFVLFDNYAEDGQFPTLLEDLRLQKAQFLRLDFECMQIQDCGAKKLGELLKGLSIPKKLGLDLTFTSIGNEGIKYIADGLQNMNEIEEFSIRLQESGIGYQGAKHLMERISGMNLLKKLSLELRSNDIASGSEEGGDGNFIKSMLKNLQNLENLELGVAKCGLSKEYISGVVQGIQGVQNLKNVKLVAYEYENEKSEGLLEELRLKLDQSVIIS